MSLKIGGTAASTIQARDTTISGYPYTFVAWVKASAFVAQGGILSVANSAASPQHSYLGVNANGTVFVSEITGALSGAARTTVTAAASAGSAWFHAAGVFSAAAARTAYIDGVGTGVNTTNVGITSNPQITFIGVRPSAVAATKLTGVSSDLLVAHAAVWNTALRPDQIGALAAGVSPLRIAPNALIRYWPMTNGAETDTTPELINNIRTSVADAPLRDNPIQRYGHNYLAIFGASSAAPVSVAPGADPGRKVAFYANSLMLMGFGT